MHISSNRRESQGLIFVYSITSRATFERLKVYRQAMNKVEKHRPVVMLIGNKRDKGRRREVPTAEGAAMARELGCKFLETSAKTGENVEGLFMDMVRKLRSSERKAKSMGRLDKENVRTSKKKVGCVISLVKPSKSRTKCIIGRAFGKE